MSELRTDFKDDVLDVTQNEKRKYRIIHNDDGTISLEDATVYLQKGDSFGANDINEMNEKANQMDKAAGEILTMGDDIDTLQEEMTDISPKVDELERRATSLLCADSDVFFKEVECDVPLAPVVANDTGNYYIVLDILYYDNKFYILVHYKSSSRLHLFVHNGTGWESITILTESSTTINEVANLQELNGVIYIAYTKNASFWAIAKYENGTVVTVQSESTTNMNYGYLAKDYDNNMLYWVQSSTYSNNNIYCTYQSFDGVNLGEKVNWYYGSGVELKGAYVKNNLLYITMNVGNNKYIIETNLTDVSANLRYRITSDTIRPKVTKKIRGEYISTSFDQNTFIFRNNLGMGLVNELCSGTAFTGCDDGLLIVDLTQSVNASAQHKRLKKLKLYKILRTYGKKGDALQCGDSFAISDNLEPIENGYRVTADGEVQIGVYL